MIPLEIMICSVLLLMLFTGLFFHNRQLEKAIELFIQSCIRRRNERVRQIVLTLHNKNRKLSESEIDEAVQLFREELKLMEQSSARKILQRSINQVNTYEQRGYAISIFSSKTLEKAFS